MTREEMILAHRGLVIAARRRFYPRLPPEVDPRDLEAAGYQGLIRAVDRYRPGESAFSTFATAYIRGAMADEMRRQDWVPRSVRERIRDGEDVPLRTVISWEQIAAAPAPLHDTGQPLEALCAEEAGPEEAGVAVSFRAAIRAALERLEPRLRRVLFEEFWQEYTLRESAAGLGRSLSRIEQLRRAAKQALREDAALREWL